MRILVVEDEKALAEALSKLLEKNKFIVDTVFDGESGLDYIKSGVYDLILLDIMLPKKDGVLVLKECRKNGIATPIILLTAKSEISDKVIGLDCGADDYITKPFVTEELLARVRAVVRRNVDISIENEIKFGDITLNLSSCQIFTERKSIKLSLKEFQIMELFIKNSNNIVTKEKLIEKVWGFDSDAEYNNVEVYISFLRKKLNYLKSNVSIKTSRGLGYYLEESNDK